MFKRNLKMLIIFSIWVVTAFCQVSKGTIIFEDYEKSNLSQEQISLYSSFIKKEQVMNPKIIEFQRNSQITDKTNIRIYFKIGRASCRERV